LSNKNLLKAISKSLYQFSKICSDSKGRDTWTPAFAGMKSKAESQSFPRRRKSRKFFQKNSEGK